MTDDASLAQVDAAHPFKSTWLSANAGSGKTRVLTNRVARLLLKGSSPQNILCLTYTKAAASEMQNRLFGTLGTWAMLDDASLRRELGELGEEPPDNLSQARTLFARAIETPGGLKIQTIHSLCASILRQFPLEGRVSPQFREMDDAARDALISEVLEALSGESPDSLANVARFFSGNSLVALAKDVAGNSQEFASGRGRDEIFREFDVSPDCTLDRILTDTFQDDDLAFLKGLVPVLLQGSVNDQNLGKQFSSLPNEPSANALKVLARAFLYQSGNRAFTAKIDALPTKATREKPVFQPNLPLLETIMTRVERGFHRHRNFEAAWKTAALHDFALAFLPAYDAAKQAHGLLDFDDLIQKTRDVLASPALSWVLFRLDGRIDHILVDEAQDTSPDQWAVIRALTEELARAGDGGRTLFVVGDKKQSIYSFQGADATGFDRHQAEFDTQLAHTLRPRELLYSFRSSPAILSVVDAVIDGADGGLDRSGRHLAFHTDMPGRFDVLPLIPQPETKAQTPWYHPTDRPADNSPSVLLGKEIAGMIDRMFKTETIQGESGKPRAIRPGDIMILVQRRSQIFDQIIQACKAAELPVAGADRLKIGAELAVRDLLAILSVLTLPEDDLSLAAVLRSPLFGWSEQDLFRLAQPRGQGVTLWSELKRRAAEFPEAYEVLERLRGRADYLRPFEMLDQVLTRFGGRRKFLERLGSEAEDGIDELLSQALAYEREAVPSITGFLARIQTEDIEIKRHSDGSDDLIRVLTVHGAKGLERPIVILPDTTSMGGRQSQSILVDEGGLAMLPLNEAQCPKRMADAKAAKKQAEAEERNRLLYVAMTRAEKWLVVCGVEPGNGSKDRLNWHQAVTAAAESVGAKPIPDKPGALRVEHGTWPGRAPRGETEPKPPEVLSGYLTENAKAPDPRRKTLSPSELGGEKVLQGGALEEAAAKKRGRQIHLLLEHLPDASDPEEAARRLLSRGAERADPEEIPGLTDEALRVLSKHPALFAAGTLAEVDISAEISVFDAAVFGTIDRLVVGPDLIQAVDFKTNAVVPERIEDVPEGLLRQMGAYLEALSQVYPDREIEVSILWTATGELMPLPHVIVRQAFLRSTIS